MSLITATMTVAMNGRGCAGSGGSATEHGGGAGACTTEEAAALADSSRWYALSVRLLGLIGRGQIIDFVRVPATRCALTQAARRARTRRARAYPGAGCGRLATFAVPPRGLPSAMFVLDDGSTARGKIAEATAGLRAAAALTPGLSAPSAPAPSPSLDKAGLRLAAATTAGRCRPHCRHFYRPARAWLVIL